MKHLIFIIYIVVFLLSSCDKEYVIEGKIVMYYSEMSPNNYDGELQMYCLDSIRLITDNDTIPILGDLVQNEHFLYSPMEQIPKDSYTRVLRSKKQYCTNPTENHIHKGGDIYADVNKLESIFIAFNIQGMVRKIVPHKNGLKNHSLDYMLDKSYQEFKEREGKCPCNFYINDNEYLIIEDILNATSLTETELKTFKWEKSNIKEFWRYGLW